MAEQGKTVSSANTRPVVPLTAGEQDMVAAVVVWIETPAEHSRITREHLRALVQYTRNLEARLAAYEPITLAMS